MGFFGRMFGGGGGGGRIPYPPTLQAQIEKAGHHLGALTEAHDEAWHIGEADWSVDQDEGTIVFDAPDRLRAVAPVQIIGTYNTQRGTWLWAWDNPSVAPALAADAQRVQAYGRQQGFEILTTAKLTCPEEQCWELTALACLLCDAQGAYRGPADATRIFFTFGEVALSKAP
jgi:hypothetical protein